MSWWILLMIVLLQTLLELIVQLELAGTAALTYALSDPWMTRWH
jgi:hypothetical protein